MTAKKTNGPAAGDKTKALYALLWMPDLSPSARQVGSWLVWHSNPTTGKCNPSQERLCKEVGLSQRQIRRGVRDLENARLVKTQIYREKSTDYTIDWCRVRAIVLEHEARANSIGVAGRERTKMSGGEDKNVRSERTEMSAKPVEDNTHKEPVFRVCPISEESEDGEYSFSPSLHPDDEVGKKVLASTKDYAFVAYLARELNNGRLFEGELSEAIYNRLESICGGHPGREEDGGTTGRAYHILTSVDIRRRDAA